MNSGTFHVISQQWRYFSREKSIIHTLHLGELDASHRGQTVIIDSTPPINNPNDGNFSVPPLTLPPTVGGGIGNVTFTNTVLSTCFGAVGVNQEILGLKNMIIQLSRWDAQEMRFLMTPQESGLFFLYIELQSDERDPSVGYFGPISPTTGGQTQNITGHIGPPGLSAIVTAKSAIIQQGPMDGGTLPLHWGPGLYIKTTHVARAYGFAYIGAGRALEWVGNQLGNAPSAYASGYMLKLADV